MYAFMDLPQELLVACIIESLSMRATASCGRGSVSKASRG